MMGDGVEELLAGMESGEPVSRRSFFMEPTIRPGLQGAVSGLVLDCFVPNTRLTRLSLPKSSPITCTQ